MPGAPGRQPSSTKQETQRQKDSPVNTWYGAGGVATGRFCRQDDPRGEHCLFMCVCLLGLLDGRDLGG